MPERNKKKCAKQAQLTESVPCEAPSGALSTYLLRILRKSRSFLAPRKIFSLEVCSNSVQLHAKLSPLAHSEPSGQVPQLGFTALLAEHENDPDLMLRFSTVDEHLEDIAQTHHDHPRAARSSPSSAYRAISVRTRTGNLHKFHQYRETNQPLLFCGVPGLPEMPGAFTTSQRRRRGDTATTLRDAPQFCRWQARQVRRPRGRRRTGLVASTA